MTLMMILHRLPVLLITLALLVLIHASPAMAQPGPGTTPLPSNVVIKGRSMYTESAVVALLIGGALFAVCRSSRRS